MEAGKVVWYHLADSDWVIAVPRLIWALKASLDCRLHLLIRLLWRWAWDSLFREGKRKKNYERGWDQQDWFALHRDTVGTSAALSQVTNSLDWQYGVQTTLQGHGLYLVPLLHHHLRRSDLRGPYQLYSREREYLNLKKHRTVTSLSLKSAKHLR